ncbi:MAG: hypothetical protein GXP40_08450 [Chloroflexi bacterium]|nr:hypothetical protein [Chloroflexota bacterium]
MKSAWKFLGLIIALSLLAVTPAQAQSPDSKFFHETKHNVTGEFWKYYQSVPDAETIFGYPITEAFTNEDGMLVQYFQRARFELHPDLPAGQQVQLTPLGDLTYHPGAQLNVDNPLACRVYPETGYPVCFSFLEFFDKHGGVAQFGFPVSPFEYQDSMIVQYFQKGRLEWHPWKPDGQRVVTGDLGKIYFDQAGEDPARLAPVSPLNGSAIRVLSLSVRAFSWKAVTHSTDRQRIFVIVQDQTLQPVPNATGVAKVHWPSGSEELLPISTDGNGVATLSLQVLGQPYGGLVNVEVLITYGENLAGETTTSFRIWY